MPRPTATATALALAGAMGAVALAGTGATAAPPPLRPGSVPPAKADYLSITVLPTGAGGAPARTYSLSCHPAGGTHPKAEAACAALDAAVALARAPGPGSGSGSGSGTTAAERTQEARLGGPFAPVPADAVCTMIHGGSATARITGIWHGKAVDARYDRSNGCEMSRWDRLVPALPAL